MTTITHWARQAHVARAAINDVLGAVGDIGGGGASWTLPRLEAASGTIARATAHAPLDALRPRATLELLDAAGSHVDEAIDLLAAPGATPGDALTSQLRTARLAIDLLLA